MRSTVAVGSTPVIQYVSAHTAPLASADPTATSASSPERDRVVPTRARTHNSMRRRREFHAAMP